MKLFCSCFIFLIIVTLSSVNATDTIPFPNNQKSVEAREVKSGFFNFIKRILFGTDSFGDSASSAAPVLLTAPEVNKVDKTLGFGRLLNDADKQINEVAKRLSHLGRVFSKSDLKNINQVFKKLNFKLADLESLLVSLRAQLASQDFNHDEAIVLLKDHLLVDLKDFRSNLLILENIENYSKSVRSLDKDLIRLQTKLDFLIKQKKDTKQVEALAKELSLEFQDFKNYISSGEEVDYEKIFNFESEIEKTKNSLSDELFILQGYIKKDDLSNVEKAEGDLARIFNPSNLGASVLRILYR